MVRGVRVLTGTGVIYGGMTIRAGEAVGHGSVCQFRTVPSARRTPSAAPVEEPSVRSSGWPRTRRSSWLLPPSWLAGDAARAYGKRE